MHAIFAALLFATDGDFQQAIRLPEPVTGPRLVCMFVLTEPAQFACIQIEVQK